MRWSTLTTPFAVGLLTVSAFSAAAASELEAQHITDSAADQPALQRHIYVGAGFGLSYLAPDTSLVPGTNVSEKNSQGLQLTVGVDINKRFSVETHYADLGSAELSSNTQFNNGDLHYSVFGASGLYYLGKARENYRRRGTTGFLRAGVGILENRADGTIRYQQGNKSHLLVGAGIEHQHRSGFGLRGEVISYDNDARYLQLGLLYRFGGGHKRDKPADAMASDATAPLVAPVAAILAEDKDHDGIADDDDICPDTRDELTVDESGCALFNGILEGASFRRNSSYIRRDARAVLNEVVAVMQSYPDSRLHVSTHADNWGEDDYNQGLTERRSAAVRDYLMAQGIPGDRIETTAFGESQPIADNASASGRARNRRVELTAYHSKVK